MNFVVFDLALLAIFLIFISVFLYKKKHNLKKEGWLVLYRTQWGVKLIDRVGTKYKKTLKFLSYISVALGYFLMAGIIYLVYQVVKIYVLYPSFVSQIKVPPVLPLLPYFTELPGIKGIFPTFYFIYFILAIVIVATIHEFSHGIFMRRYGIKIKSTGFAFLKYFPAFLGAFVEQDEKSMSKAKNFEQRAVLSAGTFSNVLTSVVFFFLLFGFFSLAFTPTGVNFDNYAYGTFEVASIISVNGIAVSNSTYEGILSLMNEGDNKVKTSDGKNYVANKEFLENFGEFEGTIGMYYDSPALNSEIKSPILEIDSVKITSLEILNDEILSHNPGEEIEIKTGYGEDVETKKIVLGEHPEDSERPWLGIVFAGQQNSGLFTNLFGVDTFFRDPYVYYDSSVGDWGKFIYDFLWWTALISLLVAFFNMLPAGGLDGGRFFYLTVLSITKNKKFSERVFAFLTNLFLLVLFLVMVLWAISFI